MLFIELSRTFPAAPAGFQACLISESGPEVTASTCPAGSSLRKAESGVMLIRPSHSSVAYLLPTGLRITGTGSWNKAGVRNAVASRMSQSGAGNVSGEGLVLQQDYRGRAPYPCAFLSTKQYPALFVPAETARPGRTGTCPHGLPVPDPLIWPSGSRMPILSMLRL